MRALWWATFALIMSEGWKEKPVPAILLRAMPDTAAASDAGTPRRPLIYVSYSRHDRKLVEQMLAVVRGLMPDTEIFYDVLIPAGDNFGDTLMQRLEEATVVLFCLSPDSLKSRYCRRELETALAQPGKRLIPIILTPCDWFGTPLATFRALPRDAKPVSTWRSRDEAFHDIARRIQAVVAPSAAAPPDATATLPAGHTARVRRVVASPDGTRAISASDDGNAIVWDLATMQPAAAARHEQPVTDLAIAANGRTVLTVSGKTLLQWDTVSNERVVRPLVTKKALVGSERAAPARADPPAASGAPGRAADSADTSSLPDALAQFESALNVVRTSLPLHIADLATALRVFEEFRSWNVGRRGPAGDFETEVRRWLELQASFDLTTRYSAIVAAVEAARAHHWTPDPADALLASVGQGPEPAAALANRRAQLADELADARRRVEASSGSDQEASAPTSTPTRRWLLAAEVESLNRVDHLLATTRGSEPLGVRFNRALARGREEGLAEGTIGRSGGLEHAIEEAVDLKHACEALQQASAAAPASGADLNELTGNLVKTARDLQQLSSELPENFFYRLAHGKPEEQDALAAAFNELLALMTPARWAYRDIRLRADLPEGAPQLGLQTVEGAPADLLFNTAELNASAQVLFLLLAPRLQNDLRLLVLDDPLQNMDELTVIRLGRALAKLRIFYPEDWSVLAFFHGEENIARIRDEAPCHIYHLPWLQTAAVGEAPIEPLSGRHKTDWQKLTSGVIADPPVRGAGSAPRSAARPPGGQPSVPQGAA